MDISSTKFDILLIILGSIIIKSFICLYKTGINNLKNINTKNNSTIYLVFMRKHHEDLFIMASLIILFISLYLCLNTFLLYNISMVKLYTGCISFGNFVLNIFLTSFFISIIIIVIKKFMTNKDYINLRVFLEAITNIEVLVSNKDSKTYLEKILKKKDNQLKLFILDNYIRKGKNISKYSFNTIAKDDLSRYPLFSF